MIITRKEKVEKSIINPCGEHIYELFGNDKHFENTTKYSLAQIEVAKFGNTRIHYHPNIEEIYYILKGKAKVIVNEIEYIAGPGDAVVIEASEVHQLFAQGREKLEFIVFCSEKWNSENTIYLDKK